MMESAVHPPPSKRWYVAFEVLHFRVKAQGESRRPADSAWRNLILIEGKSASEAFDRANELGLANTSDVWIETEAGRVPGVCSFAGLHELVMLEDGIRDGTVIERTRIDAPTPPVLAREEIVDTESTALPSWFVLVRLLPSVDAGAGAFWAELVTGIRQQRH